MFYTNTPCKAHFSSRNCTIAIELLLLLTIFGTIAIDIAIAKDTSRLLLLVLLLLRGLSELLLLLLIAIFTIGQLCFTTLTTLYYIMTSACIYDVTCKQICTFIRPDLEYLLSAPSCWSDLQPLF